MTDFTEPKTDWTNLGSITTNENEWEIVNETNVSQSIPQNAGWEVVNITPVIKITVQWSDWTEIGSFTAKKWETIMALAQANNVEIPFSCGAGACWLCLCYIVQWWEYINKEYTTPSFMQLDEDQVLTCIAAVKDECFDDENANIGIVLKRAY